MIVSDSWYEAFSGQSARQADVAAGTITDCRHGGGGVYIAGVVSETSEAVTVTVKASVIVIYTVGGALL